MTWCYLCRENIATEWHHIKPRSKGGSNHKSNLIPLCFECHRKQKLHRDWKERMIELHTLRIFMEDYDNREWERSNMPELPPVVFKEEEKTDVLPKEVPRPMVGIQAEGAPGIDAENKPDIFRDVRSELIPRIGSVHIQCLKCRKVIPSGPAHIEQTRMVCIDCSYAAWSGMERNRERGGAFCPWTRLPGEGTP